MPQHHQNERCRSSRSLTLQAITPSKLLELTIKSEKYLQDFFPGPHTCHSLDNTGLPQYWLRWVHPDGTVFYEYVEPNSTPVTLLTYIDISDPTNAGLINPPKIFQYVRLKESTSDATEYRIVIGLGHNSTERGTPQLTYYIENTVQGKSFITWNDEDRTLDINAAMDDCRLQNRDYRMQYQYWVHFQLFPLSFGIRKHYIEEFLDYDCARLLTFQTLIDGYSNERIQQLKHILNWLPDTPQRGTRQHVRAAQILAELYQRKFQNLSQGDNVNAMACNSQDYIKPALPVWFTLASPLFFWMPHVYIVILREIYKDTKPYPTLDIKLWNQFITQLKGDWKESTTPATVLLSANVGLLAIQSIDGATRSNKSVAQVALYISAILSLFAFISFQILSRRHRQFPGDLRQRHSTQWNISRYLCNHLRTFGCEMLAFELSVPLACFIWSMVTFLLAVSFVFFFNTSPVTRVMVGSVYFFLVLICGGLLYTCWHTPVASEDHVRSGTATPEDRGECAIAGTRRAGYRS